VTGIEPTTSGLLEQRRSRSDKQAPFWYGYLIWTAECLFPKNEAVGTSDARLVPRRDFLTAGRDERRPLSRRTNLAIIKTTLKVRLSTHFCALICPEHKRCFASIPYFVITPCSMSFAGEHAQIWDMLILLRDKTPRFLSRGHHYSSMYWLVKNLIREVPTYIGMSIEKISTR